MKRESELALIIAYYLSKYDRQGLANLGYRTFNDAYRAIGSRLGIKTTSIKNRRDEFDPLHDARAGWHQREMSPSRLRIVEKFSEASEPALRGIVQDILYGKTDTIHTVERAIKQGGAESNDGGREFFPRGRTGKKAEEIFLKKFHELQTKFRGRIEDLRDDGVGYDFFITDSEKFFFVEVKGLDNMTGGIGFTDKEWSVAQKKGSDYYLVVVKNISKSPQIQCIQNPADKLSPKGRKYTTVATTWDIPHSQLKNLEGVAE